MKKPTMKWQGVGDDHGVQAGLQCGPRVYRTTRALARGQRLHRHGMMGLSLGPVKGTLMSEILAGEKPKTDIAMLSPDRYS